MSPVHNLRCELERKHTDNPRSLHKAEDIVWDGDAHFHRPGTRKTLAEMLGERGLTIDFDTTPLIGRPPEFAEQKLGHEATFMTVDEAKGMLAGRSTSAAHELAEWWRETAESEIEQTVAKAIEYGSTDLVDIGRSIARVAGREVEDAEAAEMGIFFYLEGKLSRWRSAIERGDVPSFDTLLDIGVYARMAQRIRMTGGWPGTEDK